MKRINIISIFSMLFLMVVQIGEAKTMPHHVLSKQDLFKTAQKSVLSKVFVHKGTLSDKLVFSFTGDPVCTYMPKNEQENVVNNATTVSQDGQMRMTFFIPAATIKSKENKKVLTSIGTDLCSSQYCVQVKEVTAPTKGLEYTISFAPEKRGFEYLSFRSITGQKGIMFKFHDQLALRKVNNNAPSKVKRISMGKKKVILDFGHGGKDPGYSNPSVKEKDINFAVGIHLAALLKKNGHEVCLIRDTDEYVALDQRTERALACGSADALISLHANSAGNESVHGIETFCHIPSLFTSQIKASTQKISSHIDNNIYQKSNFLAQSIHANVLDQARSKKKDLVDRKVKHKVSQVLLGSDAPAILIELGFLTNKNEAQHLQKQGYQKTLAQGISKGLDDYFKKI